MYKFNNNSSIYYNYVSIYKGIERDLFQMFFQKVILRFKKQPQFFFHEMGTKKSLTADHIRMSSGNVSHDSTKSQYLALCIFTILNHVFVVNNCILHMKC